MLSLKLIIGSTRLGRAADHAIPWVSAKARAHGGFEVEVLDLRDWELPIFGETFATVGDPTDPTYSAPIVKQWNASVAGGDAYLVLTPEYNHSIPGVLKNAIDTVFASFAFRNKPVACVSYSGGVSGGVRAVDHLVNVGVEAEMVPIRSTVVLPYVNEAFDGAGNPKDPRADIALKILLDDLAWWASALQKARTQGSLPPAAFRMMAAQATSEGTR